MSKRINILETEAKAYNAMLGLEKYLGASDLTKTHKELIKIRASQINGCAFCIDMHTKDARKAGETEQRIYALSAWREAPFFTEEERAILALTEEVTLITGRVSDATYQRAEALLGSSYLAQVIMAIVTINAWNRIAVTTQLQPA
ncbi:carboxymuconolactone decarboxylase family protein [Spirosoma terrae]|uniref:Carboxymuconolactone decarboxylase family protein n=1 Tax=Spirosoma terrae TaxID=1968276 RepID=A0A6L9LET4_9BACT|nr:carboxymuconolactone decarboxylase family protein [Spirosoma terrae]NDU99014.1 carboxymuconolactone decarboxylase family protein [Spirosoma terrae]